MESINEEKQNTSEESRKKNPLTSAERQKLYRINNPEKAKQIQQKYREKTSVKNVKLLLDDKDLQIQEQKLELEQIKNLLKQFLKI